MWRLTAGRCSASALATSLFLDSKTARPPQHSNTNTSIAPATARISSCRIVPHYLRRLPGKGDGLFFMTTYRHTDDRNSSSFVIQASCRRTCPLRPSKLCSKSLQGCNLGNSLNSKDQTRQEPFYFALASFRGGKRFEPALLP